MNKGCQHCQKLHQLYPERDYQPKEHLKENCPILAETKCYNCGEIGHTPKYCKLPKSKCTHCGRIGHTADICETNEKPVKSFDNSPTTWIFMNQQDMNFENIQ